MNSLLRSKLEALRDRCIRRAGQDAEDCEHAAWMEAHSDIADELHAILVEPEAPSAEPVAYVPVHPRNGPLWANTTADPNPERLPSYPLMPLYTHPPQPPAPDFAVVWPELQRRIAELTKNLDREFLIMKEREAERDEMERERDYALKRAEELQAECEPMRQALQGAMHFCTGAALDTSIPEHAREALNDRAATIAAAITEQKAAQS